MSLGVLLLELKKLLATPEDVAKNRAKVRDLLKKSDWIAELEVARFFIAKHGHVDETLVTRIKSRDPRVRREAVSAIDLLVPRPQATQLLRRVVKDPDAATRSAARKAIRALEIVDVAPPDTTREFNARYGPPAATTPGAWNPTGWSFGIYKKWGKKKAAPPKGLPKLGSALDVAKLLNLPLAPKLKPEVAAGDAIAKLSRPGVAYVAPYVEFEIPKATGGSRTITAPKHALRKVQRRILDALLGKVAAHDASHAFTVGRSIRTNAEKHQRAAVVVKIDLEDFFPTIHYRRVAGLFASLGYGPDVAGILASLTTFRPVAEDGVVAWPGLLPQGAPTSPAIANLVCRRMDARLERLATKWGGTYTRYADDLTFSFKKEPDKIGRLLWWVDQICLQEGFVENAKKRRILRRANQQRVTGIVVNDKLTIPRKDRRRFRAIVHNAKKNGVDKEARGRKDFAAYLRGYASYIKMVQPELGAKFVAEVNAILKG